MLVSHLLELNAMSVELNEEVKSYAPDVCVKKGVFSQPLSPIHVYIVFADVGEEFFNLCGIMGVEPIYTLS